MSYFQYIRVRFQHCDPAGIVFYPRYFEMINQTVEDWFETIGMGFDRMHGMTASGVPTAQINARFHAPSRLGDVLRFTLTPRNIGGASLKLSITAQCGDELRLSCEQVLVYVSLSDGRPRPWPASLRTAIETQLQEQEEPHA
ncbi:MAG: thioesterase family protein [Paracoccaceae bacterium]